jgi:hypothetical protein
VIITMNWAERGSVASVRIGTGIERCGPIANSVDTNSMMFGTKTLKTTMKIAKVALRKKTIRNLVLILASILALVPCLGAQTPTLVRAAAHVGISSGQTDSGNNFTFQMEPAGSPRPVAAGDLIVFFGTWPSSRPQTFTDNGPNTWNQVFSPASNCQDSAGLQHGFFYAANASASTSLVTESSTGFFADTVMDFAYFYNVATTSPLDGSSCVSVTPTSNTAPNITGTPFKTTSANDLIITCVYDVSQPLGVPNPWTSITYPTNFTGLSDEPRYGHACAYWVQPTAGSFTPTFTVSQSTHDTFVIMSAAFKAGTGGSAPGLGASPILSEMQYVSLPGTFTVNLPCPSATTNITVLNDADVGANITSVTDSSGNTYSHPTLQSFFPQIYYTNSPSIPTSNTFIVNLNVPSAGGVALVGLFCTVNSNGIDTGLTAANGAILTGPGQGASTNNVAAQGTLLPFSSSGIPSVAGDLIYDAGAFGAGPAVACANSSCVFDYVGANWTGANGGDQETYANGDFMAHTFAPSTATVNFQFKIVNTSPTADSMMIALKSASASAPAPPTNLTATVH